MLQNDLYSGRDNHCTLTDGNFAAVARSMGAEGIRVARPDEIAPAFSALIESGRPCVLEIMVCGQNLPTGYLPGDPKAKPLRLMEKYKRRI